MIASSLLRTLTIPAWHARDGFPQVFRYLAQAHQQSTLSRTALKQLQHERLGRLLDAAIGHTEHYGALKLDQARPWETLAACPVMTKQDITAKLEDLRKIAAGAITHKATTGGSTGIPLTFYRSSDCVAQRKAQELYFDNRLGFQAGDKVAVFVAPSHYDGGQMNWKARLRNLTNERAIRFNPYTMTDDYVAAFVQALWKHKPSFIRCFPNALVPFLEIAERLSLPLPTVPIVTCTGETLYEHQTARIEAALNATVYEKYGTKECGVISSECAERHGQHLFEPGVYVELLQLNSDAPAVVGDLGRVVVTDLHNFGTALIRYEIGDLAVMMPEDERCPCGSTFKRFSNILGRDRDVLRDAAGTPRPGYLFVEALTDSPLSGLQMQLEQISSSELVLRIRAEEAEVNPERLAATLQSVKRLMPGFEIAACFVSAIPRDPSGKYRYVIGPKQ